MIKREAKCTLVFRHWLRASPQFSSCAFELKQAGSSLPFSALAEHQEASLLAATTEAGILYKIPDDSRSFKPFDLFQLRCAHAYVVVFYAREFCVIDIDAFIGEREVSSRKSLTLDRARQIAVVSVPLQSRTGSSSTSTR